MYIATVSDQKSYLGASEIDILGAGNICVEAVKTKQQGFTLVELMVAVIVVAILVTIAYPSYSEHIRKTRRTDAQSALEAFSNAVLRYKTQFGTFQGVCSSDCSDSWQAPLGEVFHSKSPIEGNAHYYDLKVRLSPVDATSNIYSYQLYAIPLGGQQADGCLELRSSGERLRWSNEDCTGSFWVW